MVRMKRNFISVVVPAHNEETVLAKAINSVLSSSYKSYEIIIVNDGSTDRTQQIAEHFIRKYPKTIRLFSYPSVSDKEIAKKRSPAFSRNRGAEVAKGDILFFLDADDWVRSDTLENIVKTFEKHKRINFIVGNRKVWIPKDSRRIFLYGVIAKNEIELKFNGDILITKEYTPCPYIAKTRAFKKIGFFDENFYYSEDRIFSKKLFERAIPKLLTRHIEYYTDYRSTWKDFIRHCKNVGKSIGQPFILTKFMKFTTETLISLLTFPIFFLLTFSYMAKKTGDLLLSFSSPFLFTLRRIIETYYFIKFIGIRKKYLKINNK